MFLQVSCSILLQLHIAELTLEQTGLKGTDIDAASISLAAKAERLHVRCQAGPEASSVMVRPPAGMHVLAGKCLPFPEALNALQGRAVVCMMSLMCLSCCVQVSLGRLRCEDASLYKTSPPNLRGTFPRLARHVEVQQLSASAEVLELGWRLAVTLQDISSNGFADEPANFISRYDSSNYMKIRIIRRRLCSSMTSDGCITMHQSHCKSSEKASMHRCV